MHITIEPVPQGDTCYGGDHNAWEHSTYPDSSVLAGQSRRVFLAGGSLDELRAQFPDAEVLEHSTRIWRDPNASLADLSGLPTTAPGWFDPADAGEQWEEERW